MHSATSESRVRAWKIDSVSFTSSSQALLILLIVVVLLGMKQLDRQWGVLQQIQTQAAEQTHDLARIRQTLENGVALSGPSNNSNAVPAEKPW